MKSILQSKRGNVAVFIALFALSIAANSFYRGIAHDEGLGGYCNGATRILNGGPLVTPGNEDEDSRYPARLLYMIFIAISVKLVGWNLFALHLFPYLIQLLNPLLFFIVARRFFKNDWWALSGTLLFLVHPFNVVFLNQQYSSPFFDFFLLVLVIFFQRSLDNPKQLIWFGICSSLLLFTRLEDGIIFVSWLYIAYLLHCRKYLPWRWLAASLGALFATHSLAAWYFQFPLSYPVYAIIRILHIQEGRGAGMSFIALTTLAVKIFMTWYFGGKLFAPFVAALLIIGTVEQFKRHIYYLISIFFPHFLFLLFVYNGRHDIGMIPLPQTVIPFLLLVLTGIRTMNAFCLMFMKRRLSFFRVRQIEKTPAFANLISIVAIVALIGVFSIKAFQLGYLIQDMIPASTIWQIIKTNPPLPGNLSYKEPIIRLTPEINLPIKLREEIYRSVLGKYRAENFEVIGQYVADNHIFERELNQTDFSYVDTYDSKERWEADRRNVTGDSPLWNQQFSGRIGAFPLHASGSFEYHFTFPAPIEYVIIQDAHSQWGPEDRIRLWTSPDGRAWTARYNDTRTRYKHDRYYQFFDEEFDGQTSLFIKYEFYAGDAERKGDDNRGASLDEFGLLVKYKK